MPEDAKGDTGRPNYRLFSEQEKAEIVAAYTAGELTVREIRDRWQVSVSHLLNLVRAAGVPMRGDEAKRKRARLAKDTPSVSAGQRVAIVRQWRRGVPMARLAEDYGLTRQAIFQLIELAKSARPRRELPPIRPQSRDSHTVPHTNVRIPASCRPLLKTLARDCGFIEGSRPQGSGNFSGMIRALADSCVRDKRPVARRLEDLVRLAGEAPARLSEGACVMLIVRLEPEFCDALRDAAHLSGITREIHRGRPWGTMCGLVRALGLAYGANPARAVALVKDMVATEAPQ